MKKVGLAKDSNQLSIYLSATILVNLFCLFINGYPADLGYWENWSHQLEKNGYYLFNGNYPPLYIHWLYLVTKILNYFSLPIEPNDLCKFLWELPVLISHCLLVAIVYKNLEKFKATRSESLGLMLMTVFNPAILIDGPIWGQVDLIPVVIAISAVLLNFSQGYAVLMLPTFTLALLTKFQMVCFLPVIGVLFFHRIKTHLVGIVISALIFLIVFSPFIYVHYFKEAFQAAYIETLGQYPVITMNAANLWILLVGNNAPDNIEFLSHLSKFLPQQLTYPKYLGMFFYASICLAIFILGISDLVKARGSATENLLSKSLLLSLVSAISFFTLLPAMHERYLFPAVICALVYSSITKKHWVYVVALSTVSALNMLIILGINGSDIWTGLSLLVTILFALSLLHLFAEDQGYNAVVDLTKSLFNSPLSPLIVFVAGIGLTFSYLVDRHTIRKPTVANNQMLLTNQHLLSASQGYGTIQFNRSLDGKTLSVGKRRFAVGIGTHAYSSIVFQLPAKTIGFEVIPGVDDEVSSTELGFEIWEDDKLRWASKPYYGFEKAEKVYVKLNKGHELKLIVKPNGENAWDHADWINPIVTLEK
ncbi:NPCBM/NEW2 domain-containing protein [Cellvibrio sp.]|uniref:NPCBM/NEW2 domain-containing protein n=1 Tax=Cellvibrio sp. TaxID=1965322 RepID=UPI003964886D